MRLGTPLLLAALLVAGPAHAAPPPATPPPPPAVGFGAAPTAFGAVEHGSVPNPLDADLLVHWARPAGAPKDQPLPAIAFLHGFGAPGPEPYAAWIDHIARQGVLVVYPVYPALESRGGRSRYDSMWAGIEAGLAELERTGPPPDRARFGVVGHSFGGGAAPAIAARAAGRGWGRSSLWIACFAPWYDLDRAAWDALPKSAYLLAVAYEDDAVCDPAIAASFPLLASTIPADHKGFLCFRSDDHGRPALAAEHLTPLTARGIDALDTRGSWRLEDALRTLALSGSPEARRVALGGGPEETDLGQWSDGTPVRPPLTSWPPRDGARSASRLRAWRLGGRQEEMMRKLLAPEAHSSLPLPAPDVAPASHLSAADRLLAPPPAPPWPPSVAAALAKGAVLVLPAGDALEKDAPRLAEAGVAVVRLAPDPATDLGRALAKRDEPTAMLLGRDGAVRLWKPVADPHLAAAVLDLSR